MKILNQGIDLENFFNHVSQGSLLMLDYDGTLAPHVLDRKQAFPYIGVKEKLKAINDLKSTRIVIVSGRSLMDLEHIIDLSFPLEMWGSHGFERKLVDGTTFHPPLDMHTRQGLDIGINLCLHSVDEKYCEIKPYSIALHLRAINQPISTIMPIIQKWETLSLNYNLKVHPFDGGIELRPKNRNKGDVVKELLNEVPSKTVIAYLGDDLTDEDAFAHLGDHGLKVLVRSKCRQTLADVFITPPQELFIFFNRWLEGK